MVRLRKISIHLVTQHPGRKRVVRVLEAGFLPPQFVDGLEIFDVELAGRKTDVPSLVIRAVIVVESERVASLDLFAPYVHHAAVSVERVHNRCPLYLAVLATT